MHPASFSLRALPGSAPSFQSSLPHAVGLAVAAGVQLWLVSGSAAAAAAAAAVLLLARAAEARPVAQLVLATAALGGLGMSLGVLVAPAGTAHAHPGAHAHTPALLGGWSTALMLAFCLPGCARACTAAGAGRPWLPGVVLALLGMGGGMALAAGAAARAGLGAGAGHAAMVAGMAGGAGAVLALLRAWRAAPPLTSTPAAAGSDPHP